MLVDGLDIRRLRAFQLVAKNGSLRLAAGRLKQTIPAVSLKIRRLEDSIGIELFERLPNKMILTASGARFLRDVDRLFANAEQALRTLASPQVEGHLSISMGSDHSWYFAPRISSFLNKNPGVEVSLQVYRARDAIVDLQRGELYLAFGIFPNLPRGLRKETITETTLALLCPSGHSLTRRRHPRLADIAAHRLILPPTYAETRKIIDDAFARAGASVDDMLEVSNCSTAKTFVEQGVGLAIVHSLCVSHAPSPNLQWLDLGKHFGRIEFCLVYRKAGARSAVLQNLLDELCPAA
jgi:DNA-binding transcriptional LysR family regulator